MVVYQSYFVEDNLIHLGIGYTVQLMGKDYCFKYVMTLIRFKKIFSAFHLESINYLVGNKYRQLCCGIHVFNDKSKIIFVPGQHSAFYEVGIDVRIRYCPVMIFN